MTPKNPRTLIVMPALNEEVAIGSVILAAQRSLPNAGILVVDDGSTDETSAVATSLGAKVARLPYNLGVGGAMRLGFKYALSFGYEYVVQVDADGQHDPREIAKLLKLLDDADLVLGSRFSTDTGYVSRGPRKWAMSVLALVLSTASGSKLTDTTSGFRASGPRAIELFSRHYPAEYLGDTVETLVIASRAGLTIVETPVVMHTRTGGKPSHNPIKAAVFLARVVVAIFVAFLRPPHEKVHT